MNTKILPALFTLGGLALLSGCATPRESVLVSAPPPPVPTTGRDAAQPVAQPVATPQVVTTTNVPVGTNRIIVVQAEPPPPPPEAVPERPSPAHAWITGYYTWQNNRYEWVAGRWETPPRRGSIWVEPKWVREGESYRFYEGYWN
jgi:hypothetical protein